MSLLLFVYYLMILLFVLLLRLPEPVGWKNRKGALSRQCIWTLIGTNTVYILYVSHVIRIREINDTLFILLVMAEICALSSLINSYCAQQLYAFQLEMDTHRRLEEQREQQFLSASQSQALINQKCHDLKHYIFYLRQQDYEKTSREHILEEMEEAVNTFDQRIQTGNTDLDTVLTEEMNLFHQNQIEFHCIADGSLLHFMRTLDLYVLFGNILDNCRESLLKEENPDRRHVSMNISRKQNMVLIQTENYSDKTINLVNGLPVTSKEDVGNHGIGLRSVRSIVESYNGFLTVRQDDGVFTLSILLPCQGSTSSV